MYSKKTFEHIKKPRNMGEIKNPDAVGKAGNPVCGDTMKIYLKISKRQGQDYIQDIKFQTLGCGAAIAASSMMTTMVKGKTLDEATKITKQKVAKALGGLPPVKIHCSVLAVEVLQKAIKNFKLKK